MATRDGEEEVKASFLEKLYEIVMWEEDDSFAFSDDGAVVIIQNEEGLDNKLAESQLGESKEQFFARLMRYGFVKFGKFFQDWLWREEKD